MFINFKIFFGWPWKKINSIGQLCKYLIRLSNFSFKFRIVYPEWNKYIYNYPNELNFSQSHSKNWLHPSVFNVLELWDSGLWVQLNGYTKCNPILCGIYLGVSCKWFEIFIKYFFKDSSKKLTQSNTNTGLDLFIRLLSLNILIPKIKQIDKTLTDMILDQVDCLQNSLGKQF